MRSANPPRVATWLLTQFTSADRLESLTGDIIEQYGCKRSRAWYWRQVIASIIAEIVSEVRYHPLFTARALLLGWTLRWIGKEDYVRETLEAPGRSVALHIGNWLLNTDHESLRYWWFTSHVSLLPRWGVWWIVCAGIGWTVAYSHRRRQSSILVLLFALSVLVAVSPWVISNVEHDHWGFIVGAVPAFVGFSCTLVGGLLSARSGEASSSVAID
jgi:hypothetical protein